MEDVTAHILSSITRLLSFFILQQAHPSPLSVSPLAGLCLPSRYPAARPVTVTPCMLTKLTHIRAPSPLTTLPSSCPLWRCFNKVYRTHCCSHNSRCRWISSTCIQIHTRIVWEGYGLPVYLWIWI